MRASWSPRDRTPAWLATNFGARSLLRTLLAAGHADAQAHDRQGVAPLWVAAARGDMTAAFTLLHHGCARAFLR